MIGRIRHFGKPSPPKSNIHPTSSNDVPTASGMAKLRTAPGMRERAPGVWELVVEAGRDPVTGKRRQASRMFRGNLREAKKARAELLVDVTKGRHTGSRATLDDLFAEWIIELRRKGRSPNTVHGYELVYRRNIQPTLGTMQVTKVTTKTLTDLYGAHQRRGLAPRSVYQIHACLSSMFTQACRWGWRDSNPAQWAEPPSIPNHRTGRADARASAGADRRSRARQAPRDGSSDPRRRHHRAAASRTVRATAVARPRPRAGPAASVGVDRQPCRPAAHRDSHQEPPDAHARPRRPHGGDPAGPARRSRGASGARPRRDWSTIRTCSPTRPMAPSRGSPTPSRSTSVGCASESVSTTSTSITCASSWRPTARRWATASRRSPCAPAMIPSIAAKHYSGRVSETDRALAKAVASLIAPPTNAGAV